MMSIGAPIYNNRRRIWKFMWRAWFFLRHMWAYTATSSQISSPFISGQLSCTAVRFGSTTRTSSTSTSAILFPFSTISFLRKRKGIFVFHFIEKVDSSHSPLYLNPTDRHNNMTSTYQVIPAITSKELLLPHHIVSVPASAPSLWCLHGVSVNGSLSPWFADGLLERLLSSYVSADLRVCSCFSNHS